MSVRHANFANSKDSITKILLKMAGVGPLLNCQRTFNELTGECFTAAFPKANHTIYTLQKAF